MRIPGSAGVAGLILAAGTAHAEVPNVVVSIAPVHSLVASVMEGVGEPALLIPADVSDHDHALRPSDLRAIAAADLVVWVGESLEAYLVAPLEAEGTENLELIEAAGIDAHPYAMHGEGEEEEEHAAHAHDEHATHAEEEEHAAHAEEAEEHATEEHAAEEHGHHHDHFGLDPHVWLDPVRAQAIVTAVADRLAEIDPENAARYRDNATAAASGLTALDAEIRARLEPLAAEPFITFHDGYSYFVERYGLNQVGELTVDPERSPGVATIQALQQRVADDGVACAFAEPQFDPGVVESLAGEADIRIGVIDALGAGLTAGPELYGQLLRRNAAAMEGCLAPTT